MQKMAITSSIRIEKFLNSCCIEQEALGYPLTPEARVMFRKQCAHAVYENNCMGKIGLTQVVGMACDRLDIAFTHPCILAYLKGE